MILEHLHASSPELARARVVVDYGCGSGVLALAALAIGPPQLTACAGGSLVSTNRRSVA